MAAATPLKAMAKKRPATSICEAELNAIAAEIRRGDSRSEICYRHNISIDVLATLRKALGIKSVQGRGGGRPKGPIVDPSPEEIRVRTAAIRSTWTTEERAQRAGQRPLWERPTISQKPTTRFAPVRKRGNY